MIIHSRAKVTFSMKSKSKMAARSPREIQLFQASYSPTEVPGLSKPSGALEAQYDIFLDIISSG